jgi:pyruvate/2-oxoglutarate dehydrogenase complex dihydrolipoamide dehydrogenase (E3) component
MATRYDAIIIGTGQSGPALAARLSKQGMSVAVIERNRFGGTCVNTGCIPTKALVASAYAAQLARRAAEYGVVLEGTVSVDMKRVKARKDAISGKASSSVETWMSGLKTGRVIHGHAEFQSPRKVSVNDEVLESDRIFINVGARPLVPPMAGVNDVDYLTSSSIMDVDFVPEHLLVIGGSYIGLEFGQMYRRFGSRVTLIEKAPRLIAREDADVSQAVLEILQKEGVAVELNADCLALRKTAKGVAVRVQCEGAGREVEGSHLLLAIGRVPNTQDLGLDKAGVKVNDKGYIEVDDGLRTNVEGIWALGDCNGRGAFTHTSYNDYEIVADNLLEGAKRSVNDRITAYALFIDPPLGRVGMTEDEVRKAGRNALVGKRPMTRVGRAVEKGETQGFIKITVDAESKQILGAAILGVGGDEAIHSLLDAMYAKAPYTTVTHAMHIHPTVSELLPTVLGEMKPLV